MSSRSPRLLSTALLLLAAAASAGELVVEPYVFEAGARKVDAELGKFSVPENRAAEDSRQIELAFVRFRSTAANPGVPIVYLAGGPGGSGSVTARGTRFPLFQAMRSVADVIAFDQRGTGLSELLPACSRGWKAPLDQPMTRESLGAVVEEAARFCAREWRDQGIDLDGYNTEQSADDLESLRLALGVPKITLWSISYGTHLAFATVKRHPDSIDRLILAGTEGPDQTLKLPSDQQALLEALAERIAADPETAEMFPSFLDDVRVVLERLGRQPEKTYVFVRGVGRVDMMVSAFDIQYVAAGTLRGPQTMRLLPRFFAQMRDGDFSGLRPFLTLARSGSIRGMPAAMDSASGATGARLARISEEAARTLLADAINFPWTAINRGLDVRDLGDDFRATVVTDIPALFISGTLDGRTHPNHAFAVLPGFSNARHLILEGAGHSDPLFLSSPEILDIMLAFLRDEELPRERRLPVPVPSFATLTR